MAPKSERFSPEVLALMDSKSSTGTPTTSLDLTKHNAASSIDGQLWGELLRAGFAHLVATKDECNRINVFPVPDGDTGTNMCLTVQGGVKSFGDKPPTADLAELSGTFAARAMLTAQGNSGTILTFFFSTLSKEIGAGTKALDVQAFMAAIGRVGTQMMKSMQSAKIGTMLSVVQEASLGLAEKGQGAATVN